MSNFSKKNKFLVIWLYLTVIVTIITILIGGVTRLSRSGLSITEWNIVIGVIPPLNQDNWNIEFNKYQESPEYKNVNSKMTLVEFKKIFWIEFIHRFFARSIFFFYCIPLLYFILRKKIVLNTYFLSILILIIFQGFLGWYMVKSGLTNNPYISHYRLSLHFIFALFLLGMLFWKAKEYSISYEEKYFQLISLKRRKFFLYLTLGVGLLFIIQSILGCFVSGLKIPHIIYSTVENSFIHNFLQDPNFENLQKAKFFHRSCAVIFLLYIFIVNKIFSKSLIDVVAKNASFLVLIISLAQFLIGMITLFPDTPKYIFFLHQVCAITLFLCFLNLLFIVLQPISSFNKACTK